VTTFGSEAEPAGDERMASAASSRRRPCSAATGPPSLARGQPGA